MCRPTDTVGSKPQKDKAGLLLRGAKINVLCRACYNHFALTNAYMVVAVIIAGQDRAE